MSTGFDSMAAKNNVLKCYLPSATSKRLRGVRSSHGGVFKPNGVCKPPPRACLTGLNAYRMALMARLRSDRGGVHISRAFYGYYDG
jgi:hypothetical protein